MCDTDTIIVYVASKHLVLCISMCVTLGTCVISPHMSPIRFLKNDVPSTIMHQMVCHTQERRYGHFFYSFLFTIPKGHIVCVVIVWRYIILHSFVHMKYTKREEEQYLFCELHFMMMGQKDYLFTSIERAFHSNADVLSWILLVFLLVQH